MNFSIVNTLLYIIPRDTISHFTKNEKYKINLEPNLLVTMKQSTDKSLNNTINSKQTHSAWESSSDLEQRQKLRHQRPILFPSTLQFIKTLAPKNKQKTNKNSMLSVKPQSKMEISVVNFDKKLLFIPSNIGWVTPFSCCVASAPLTVSSCEKINQSINQ